MIVATLWIRNEEDIIAQTLDHHIRQGVDVFIITDNGSTDKTKEIVSSYPQVKILLENNKLTHDQELGVTKMAKIACKFDPDWIIHIDADEFWCNLEKLEGELEIVTRVYEHLPMMIKKSFTIEQEPYFLENRFINYPGVDPKLLTRTKVAHRKDPEIEILAGNHRAKSKFLKFGLKISSVEIHHFPIRAYKQFKDKIVQGAEAIFNRPQIRQGECVHWTTLYENFYEKDELRKVYNGILIEAQSLIKEGKSFGTLRKWP